MTCIRLLTTRYIFLGVTLVILPGFLAFAPACAASDSASWEVLYDASNLTNAAAPLPMGPTVLLNVAGLGPMLGVTITPDADGFLLQSADGKSWHWETGDTTLTSDSQVISLAMPGLQEGTALYLDPQAISELCRIPVTVDTSTKRVEFRRPDATASRETAQDALPDGWQSFTITKPKTDKKSAQFILSPKMASSNLPPDHDRLNIGLGIGYVQGADCGLEITSSGRLAGGDLSMSGVVTDGDLGTRLRSSHLMWLDREGGTGVEAGDMYSETWGLVQGIRYLWKTSGNHWPTVSLNLSTSRTDNPHPSLSYLDELKLGTALSLRAEIGTDKSQYMNFRYDGYPFQLFAFRRLLSQDLGKSEGVYGSLSLSRSVWVFYGTTSTTDQWDKTSVYKNVGVRLPLFRRWGLTLGQTQFQDDNTCTTSSSAGITVPLSGVMHLYLRYQRNSWDVDTLSGTLLNMHSSTDTLLTSLSLFASPKVHLDYQRNSVAQEGRTVYCEQLVTNYMLSPATTIQAISGFPNITDSDILRLRLDHRLKNDLSLTVDYGKLSPFQSKNDVFGKRGFMVMLRKTWPISVPARGGNVSGLVVDQLGQPVQSVSIRMGNYTAVSDKNGRYTFSVLPTGKYKIGIADDSVPADYKVETTAQEIKVERDSTQQVDFKLVPFGCILGRVYMDKDGDNSYDPGEGVSDIAVCANDRVTATDAEGRFAFFNLDPAHYTVRVAAEYLDKKYAVHGSASREVDLPPKGSITDAEFRLEYKKKPIIFAQLD